MKTIKQRLNNIAGQIEGVRKMSEEGNSCIDVLTQLKAIRSAITGVMNMVIEDQVENCLTGLSNEQKKLLIKIKDYVKTN